LEDLAVAAACAIIAAAAVERRSCWVSATVWDTRRVIEGYPRERSKDIQEAKLSLGQPTVLPHSRLSSN